jgi:tetratricopeptide (TPR) repeat protein
VGLATYSRWEYGNQKPRLSSLLLLCEAFGVSPEALGFGHLVKPVVQEPRSVPEEKVLSVTDLSAGVLALQQEQSFGELQEHVEHVLRRFLDMDLSRRSLIALLTSIPAAAFTASIPGEMPLLRDDEVVSLAAVNIPLAWRLYFAGGLAEVWETLPTYITTVATLAQRPSPYQQRAAGLTSQAHQLGYLLELQRQNFGLALDHAKKALHYAHVADDNNLRLASLVRQANLFHVMKRPVQALVKYREAIYYHKQVSPLLLGQAYIGLAEAAAKSGQAQEAQRFRGLAHDTFPANPTEDLHFTYTHFNHFTRVNFEGLMYLHLDQPQQAWDTFAAIEKEVPAALVPQKVELLMRQTLALVKLGEMPQSCDHLELATVAAFKLGSDLRRNEAGEIYDQMLLTWPHEQKVKSLAELFQH